MNTRTALLRVTTGVLVFLVGWQMGVWYQQSAQGARLGDDSAGLVSPGESASGVTVKNPRRDVDMTLVWDVWDTLIDHYISPEELEVTPLVYGAAEGLVRAVGDPYTTFMTPQENQEFQDGLRGNLEGIGAELTMRDDLVEVVTPLKGSPAERAGLLPKDVIDSVDGTSVEGMNLNQVVSRIRGPKGTVVKIKVFREKVGAVELEIIREQIHIPSVESKIIESGGKTVGYVALNQFGESSIAELKQELQEFRAKKVNGIVLDLRNNGGGYLDGAVELVSLFLEEGVVVRVERRDGPTESQYVSGRTMFPEIPLVVLQNEATASASEIVTGALQDHDRATIVGQKSFGKGTVQEVIDLEDGVSLRVTVARWLTPDGKNLGKDGVHPDLVVEAPKPEDREPGEEPEDPQLDAAVEVVTGKRTVEKTTP